MYSLNAPWRNYCEHWLEDMCWISRAFFVSSAFSPSLWFQCRWWPGWAKPWLYREVTPWPKLLTSFFLTAEIVCTGVFSILKDENRNHSSARPMRLQHSQRFAWKYGSMHDTGQTSDPARLLRVPVASWELERVQICPAVKSPTQWRNICSDVTFGQRRSKVTGWAVGLLAKTLWQDVTTDNTEKIERWRPCLPARRPTGQSCISDSRGLESEMGQRVSGKYFFELVLVSQISLRGLDKISAWKLKQDTRESLCRRQIKTKHFYCGT